MIRTRGSTFSFCGEGGGGGDHVTTMMASHGGCCWVLSFCCCHRENPEHQGSLNAAKIPCDGHASAQRIERGKEGISLQFCGDDAANVLSNVPDDNLLSCVFTVVPISLLRGTQAGVPPRWYKESFLSLK